MEALSFTIGKYHEPNDNSKDCNQIFKGQSIPRKCQRHRENSSIDTCRTKTIHFHRLSSDKNWISSHELSRFILTWAENGKFWPGSKQNHSSFPLQLQFFLPDKNCISQKLIGVSWHHAKSIIRVSRSQDCITHQQLMTLGKAIHNLLRWEYFPEELLLLSNRSFFLNWDLFLERHCLRFPYLHCSPILVYQLSLSAVIL